MGVDVLLCGPLPTPGHRLHHPVDAGRRRRGHQRQPQPLPGQRHQVLRPRRLQAARRERAGDRAAGAGRRRRRRPTSTACAPPPSCIGKAKRIDDAIGRYVVFLKSLFPRELTLDGLTIVVDCAHGAAYQVAPAVFEELGAKVIAARRRARRQNINDGCGALHPEGMAGRSATRGRPRHRPRRRRRPGHRGRRERAGGRRRRHHGHRGPRPARAAGGCAKKTVVATVMSNLGLERSWPRWAARWCGPRGRPLRRRGDAPAAATTSAASSRAT